MDGTGNICGPDLPDDPVLPEIRALSVRSESIRRWLGCGRAIRSNYEKQIDGIEQYALANHLVEPMAAIRFLGVGKMTSEAVWLSNGTVLEGMFFHDHIKSARRIAVAATHIGSRLETAVHALMTEKRLFKALLLEAYGNAALEALTGQIGNHVSMLAKRNGSSASSPYFFGSPGLPLGTHFRLDRFFPGNPIHMAYTQAGGFRPAKSAFMIMGIGDRMPTWPAAHMCRNCRKRDTCAYRHGSSGPRVCERPHHPA